MFHCFVSKSSKLLETSWLVLTVKRRHSKSTGFFFIMQGSTQRRIYNINASYLHCMSQGILQSINSRFLIIYTSTDQFKVVLKLSILSIKGESGIVFICIHTCGAVRSLYYDEYICNCKQSGGPKTIKNIVDQIHICRLQGEVLETGAMTKTHCTYK